MGSSRRGTLLRLVLVCWCFLTTVACGDERAPPERLLDGSRTTAAKPTLEGVDGPTVATRLDLVSQHAVRSCLGSARRSAGQVVRRVGVNGFSVTFALASRRGLYACDSSAPQPSRDGGWCGRAYGRVQGGHLTDSRLDLACVTAEGDSVAFVWIEPAAGTQFVAVRQHGFVEVYEVAARLPVRVTATDVALDESTASLEVSEHDDRGVSLRAYRLEARVAG